tara:strand:+ start:21 stop:1208 length:1188 start_codon:yes stop_codon:yes gene_type:complete
MPSIKLGQAFGLLNQFLGAGKGMSAHPKQAAVDLLQRNRLDPNKSPTAHLTVNPLKFQHIQFPEDLGVDGGHYMIFYSISNNKSLDIDKEFNAKIGASIDGDDIYENVTTNTPSTTKPGTATQYQSKRALTGRKYKVRALKKSAFSTDTVKIGKPAANSVLTGGLQTHTTVTGGVALYMPPGIKASYSAETGHQDLELAGLAARTLSRSMAAGGTQAQVSEFLKGVGGFALDAAKKMAVGLGDATLGNVSGAISKVTGTAENNFSEAIFRQINPRSFSYTFSLIARNQQEAKTIQKIIKFFKFHMHPELDEANSARYFRVPSEFEIHYAYNDQKNNYLHELSRCVCSSVEVDYGGDSFQTFRQFDGEGAPPVNVSLSLTFTETTLLTKKQIAEGF